MARIIEKGVASLTAFLVALSRRGSLEGRVHESRAITTQEIRLRLCAALYHAKLADSRFSWSHLHSSDDYGVLFE